MMTTEIKLRAKKESPRFNETKGYKPFQLWLIIDRKLTQLEKLNLNR